MFFEHFVYLCKKKGVSPSKATADSGINKSAVTYWKNNPDARPSGKNAQKLCEYFGISIGELYGEQDTKKEPAPEVRDKLDEDIWNAITQIPDEKREEALRYLQYLASQSEQ